MSGSHPIDTRSPARRLRNLFESTARRLARRLTGCREAFRGTFHLALVIPVDDCVAHFSTKLQLEIMQKYGRNPGLEAYPHVTLKMGFDVADPGRFDEYLDQLARTVRPFDIKVRNFGFFDEGILFLDIEPNPALEQLRQRILADLAAFYGIAPLPIEGNQYRFHITLAYGLADSEFMELRQAFESQEVEFTFKARHVAWFCHTGRNWVSYRRAALGGAELPEDDRQRGSGGLS